MNKSSTRRKPKSKKREHHAKVVQHSNGQRVVAVTRLADGEYTMSLRDGIAHFIKIGP